MKDFLNFKKDMVTEAEVDAQYTKASDILALDAEFHSTLNQRR